MEIAATPRSTRNKYLYYFSIVLGGIFFIISGVFEITKNPATYPKTLSMGYPPYFITALGIAKVLGAFVLMLPWTKKWREWAFAGFTFDVIFAFISGVHIQSLTECIKSGTALIFILLVYSLYLKYEGRPS
jgi:uncharacterized membrane protein YphA (DoxX/SURF4 family)